MCTLRSTSKLPYLMCGIVALIDCFLVMVSVLGPGGCTFFAGMGWVVGDNIRWKPHIQWKHENLSIGCWILYLWTRFSHNCYMLFCRKTPVASNSILHIPYRLQVLQQVCTCPHVLLCFSIYDPHITASLIRYLIS